jgi:hypothetical protein
MAENGLDAKNPSTEELQAEVERLRAEKYALQAQLAKQVVKKKRHFPWRGIIAWILIVLACLMAIVSPIAVWAKTTFMDTDKFVSTVGPLIEEEEVAKALSDEIANRLYVGLDIQRRVEDALNSVTEAIQEAVPDKLDSLAGKLDFIAGPISTGLQTLIQKITYEVLTSSQFQEAWYKILEASHSTVVRIINGEGAISIGSEGEVMLDVGELANNVQDRLVEGGLTFLEKVPIPDKITSIELFTSSQLGMAKTGIEILNTLNWLLPLLALLFFAAAILISEDRRRYLMIAGAALAVAMAFSLMVLNLAKGELLGQVKNPANLEAATIIWNQVTAQLIKANVGLLFVGVIGAVGFAISGPYKWAVWLRRKTQWLFSMERDRRLAGKESGPVGLFFAAHIWGIRVFGAAFFFGVLWLIKPLTGVKVVVVLCIFLIYLVICELLRGKLPEAAEAVEAVEADTSEEAAAVGPAEEPPAAEDAPQAEDAGKEDEES